MVFMVCFNLAIPIWNSIYGTQTIFMDDSVNTTQRLDYTLSDINPTPSADQISSQSSYFDFFNLGIFGKIQNFLKNTIFAFPTLFSNLGLINDVTYYSMNTLISFIYLSGLVSMFSKGFVTISEDYR